MCAESHAHLLTTGTLKQMFYKHKYSLMQKVILLLQTSALHVILLVHMIYG